MCCTVMCGKNTFHLCAVLQFGTSVAVCLTYPHSFSSSMCLKGSILCPFHPFFDGLYVKGALGFGSYCKYFSSCTDGVDSLPFCGEVCRFEVAGPVVKMRGFSMLIFGNLENLGKYHFF